MSSRKYLQANLFSGTCRTHIQHAADLNVLFAKIREVDDQIQMEKRTQPVHPHWFVNQIMW